MKFKVAFILLTTLILFNISRAQEVENNELSKITIPENIKQEIVSRILIFKFKPSKHQKVIYLAKEGVDSSWLPKIPNIEFRLLSDLEIEKKDRGVYFFTAPELEKQTYSIGFVFGDSQCKYAGESWRFRIRNNKLKLWYSGGIGGGCGSSVAESDFKTPGELNIYPNELEGFRFFDSGKLRGLSLTVSTREDVKKNFGSECENSCDYDNNWKIYFSYFGSMTKEATIENKKIELVPKEELIGKIYSISLTPKQQLSFSRITFSKKFNELDIFSVGDSFDSEGNLSSAVGTSYKRYFDRFGLSYNIFKNGYIVGKSEKDTRRTDSLISIAYTIPNKIEETMFVIQK